MKINEFINESTTAGSIATVAAPMTTQKRNNIGKGVYGNEKPGTLLTGKKTNKKYANSVNESKMKQVAVDLENMQDGNFKQKYGKSKEKMMALLGTPANMKPKSKAEVNEAQLDEEDKLVDPKKGHKRKTGLHGKDEESRLSQFKGPFKSSGDFVSDSRGNSVCDCDNEDLAKEVAKALNAYVRKDEGVIAAGGVGEAKKNKLSWHAKQVTLGKDGKYKVSDISFNDEGDAALVASNENGEAIITWDDGAKEYTLTVNGKKYPVPGPHKYPTQAKELGAKILAGVNENLANWNMGVQSLPRTTPWKRKAITAISPGAWPKEYTFDTEQEAIQHFTKDSWEKIKSGVPNKHGESWEVVYADDVNEGIKEKIKGAIRREKAKDMPLVQTRRDYAMGKAGQAYEKGEPRKGAQYSAWAERDRKKKGDPSTNPAGTYRTKTSDYTNEGAMTTKQPKGEKPWKPSMDRPKGEYDPVLGKAPRKGTVAYNNWKRQREASLKGDLSEAQSMKDALKNTLAKAEPGSKLDQSIKRHNSNIKAGYEGTLKNAPTGYHFDKKGYCRLGDK